MMVLKWLGLIVGLAAIGWADFKTGYDVSLSVFYTAPVIFAAWHLGNKAGTVAAGLAAVVRMVAVMAMGHQFSGQWMLFWNTAIFFAFLELIVVGASAVRQQLMAAQSKVGILEKVLWTCASCDQIEGDDGHWSDLKTYLADQGLTPSTNKLCPDCARKLYAERVASAGGGR